jgi:hypothetical protein
MADKVELFSPYAEGYKCYRPDWELYAIRFLFWMYKLFH